MLDKLHYDPKIIDDDFSINVYEDFIDAVDSQKRFLLKSDIELFSDHSVIYQEHKILSQQEVYPCLVRHLRI